MNTLKNIATIALALAIFAMPQAFAADGTDPTDQEILDRNNTVIAHEGSEQDHNEESADVIRKVINELEGVLEEINNDAAHKRITRTIRSLNITVNSLERNEGDYSVKTDGSDYEGSADSPDYEQVERRDSRYQDGEEYEKKEDDTGSVSREIFTAHNKQLSELLDAMGVKDPDFRRLIFRKLSNQKNLSVLEKMAIIDQLYDVFYNQDSPSYEYSDDQDTSQEDRDRRQMGGGAVWQEWLHSGDEGYQTEGHESVDDSEGAENRFYSYEELQEILNRLNITIPHFAEFLFENPEYQSIYLNGTGNADEGHQTEEADTTDGSEGVGDTFYSLEELEDILDSLDITIPNFAEFLFENPEYQETYLNGTRQ